MAISLSARRSSTSVATSRRPWASASRSISVRPGSLIGAIALPKLGDLLGTDVHAKHRG